MVLMSIENPAYLTWIQLYDPDNPWIPPALTCDLETAAAPLYYAALLGLSTITKLLLNRGDEVNTQGGYYGSALQAASYEGHEQVVKILLDNKAEVNVQGGKYSNALQSASAAGHQGIVHLLLDNGADVNRQGGFYINALNTAAAAIHTDIVKLLLENGAEISQYDFQGKSVLHHAINSTSCTTSLAELLLSKGAPTDTADLGSMTPLHYSVRRSQACIAGLLLDQGVPIDAGIHRNMWCRSSRESYNIQQVVISGSMSDISCTSTGLMALRYATSIGNPVMTNFVLKRGADPNAAQSRDHEVITRLLRTNMAKTPSLVASKDTCGRNSLHHLLPTGLEAQIETIQLLLDNGVDVSELDISGLSPLASCFEHCQLAINANICHLMLSFKLTACLSTKMDKI